MRPGYALLISLAAVSCASETQPLDPNTVPLPRAAPKHASTSARPISTMVKWQSVSEPLTAEQVNLDQAKCALSANLAIRTSPELKFNVIFARCMRAKGYRARTQSTADAAADAPRRWHASVPDPRGRTRDPRLRRHELHRARARRSAAGRRPAGRQCLAPREL